MVRQGTIVVKIQENCQSHCHIFNLKVSPFLFNCHGEVSIGE